MLFRSQSVATAIGSRIAMLTQHLYPLAPTSAVAPTASNVASIAHLLGTTARSTEDSAGNQVNLIARGVGIPWRMAETNSCYNGGEKGVSDVYASALWGVDYMFTLAGRSVAGINFHGGGTGNYTPIAVSGSQVTARPLYYALLLFHAAGRGRLVPLDVSAGSVNLTAYAALDPGGSLHLVATNKDLTQDAALTITPGAGYQSALAMRLTGTALDLVTGTTLGGAGVQSDGSWLPATLESARLSGTNFITPLPAGSAMLINFGNNSLTALNAASGQAETAPDGFVSAYGQALSIVEASVASASFPTTLAGVTATLTDASGVERPTALSYVAGQFGCSRRHCHRTWHCVDRRRVHRHPDRPHRPGSVPTQRGEGGGRAGGSRRQRAEHPDAGPGLRLRQQHVPHRTHCARRAVNRLPQPVRDRHPSRRLGQVHGGRRFGAGFLFRSAGLVSRPGPSQRPAGSGAARLGRSGCCGHGKASNAVRIALAP